MQSQRSSAARWSQRLPGREVSRDGALPEGNRFLRAPAPGKGSCSRKATFDEPFSLIAVEEGRLQCNDQGVDFAARDDQGAVSHHLIERRAGASDRGSTARERLQHWQPKALVAG